MAVALDHLRRGRCRLEPEPLTGDALQLGVGRRVGADRAGELADAHSLERPGQAAPAPIELERPHGELEPEGRGLRVHPVRAPDRDGVLVFHRTCDDRSERSLDTFEQERSGGLELERESGVEHVRGGQAVVEPAALGPELLRDRVDERREVVVGRALDLRNALRARRDCVRADRAHVLRLRQPVAVLAVFRGRGRGRFRARVRSGTRQIGHGHGHGHGIGAGVLFSAIGLRFYAKRSIYGLNASHKSGNQNRQNLGMPG